MSLHDSPVHPYAATYPIETAVLEAMAADMRANGFDSAHPIVFGPGGVLLDGRTRLRAAELAGVDPVCTTAHHLQTDVEIIDFIRRSNEQRRGSMTKYQRLVHACLAADAQNLQRPSETELREASGLNTYAQVRRALDIFCADGEEHRQYWTGEKPFSPIGRSKFPRRAPTRAAEQADRSTLLSYASPADRITIETGDGDVDAALDRTRQRAAVAGYAPEYGWQSPVPKPHVAKGLSTLHGADGSVKLQWVKSSLKDQDYQEAVRLVAEELAKPCEGVAPPVPPNEPVLWEEDLLNLYIIGDAHVGMMAWAKETLGKDYDLDIAERLHRRAMRILVDESPATKRFAVINLGDFFHTDNYDGLTRSGHRLDTDSRLPKMAEVGVRTLKHMTQYALERHGEGELHCIPGNHDMNLAFMMTLVLEAHYSHEPRFTVNKSPALAHYIEFGKTLIGMIHGHTVSAKIGLSAKKAQDLAAIMSTDQAEAWGRTVHRHFIQGHVHSSNRVDAAGVICETFQNLASNDAWHAGERYRSGRSMTRITYHREWGEIARGIVPADRALQAEGIA